MSIASWAMLTSWSTASTSSYPTPVACCINEPEPRAIHSGYTDMRYVDIARQVGPSAALATNLCASLVAVEAMALVLGRRLPRAAPAYLQIDLYRQRLVRGTVWLGARNPFQRLRRWFFRRALARLGITAESLKL